MARLSHLGKVPTDVDEAAPFDLSRLARSTSAAGVLVAGASLATTLAVMFAVGYANYAVLEHVIWNGTSSHMIFDLGATVAVAMLGLIVHTYRSVRAKLFMAVGAVTIFAGSFLLLPSQGSVQYQFDVSGVDPSHSAERLSP